MSRINPDELAALLSGTMQERADCEALEIVVTLRKPDEVEALLSENKALRIKITALEDEVNARRMEKLELVHYGQMLARARRELKRNGLPFDWIK